MSRIGKIPVVVPGGVKVQLSGRQLSVSGAKGNLSWTAPSTASIVFDEAAKQIRVTRSDDSKQSRANHGLTRALIANMVKGVSVGYEKILQIYGTGYNCKVVGKMLHLNVGFSGRNRGVGSQFELPIPQGIDVTVEKEAARGDNEPAQMVIRGFDKQLVGEFAAVVRAIRRTEPYKGKGIRYKDEVIKKKQGKALTSGG